MCKLNNITGKAFLIYHLISENYIGVTTNIHKRLLKHSSKSGFCIKDENVKILYSTYNLKDALEKELQLQKDYKCKKGIRNQNGGKNPFSKIVLDLNTGIFYDTIKEACIAKNFSYSLVRHYVKYDNNKFNLIKV